MLLAKQEEAGVTLTDEHNDFLVADATWMEQIEELSANICLMARIQPANINSNAGLSYDYAFLNVNNGSVEYDNNVQASYELEQLARNAYKEAEKQQINAKKMSENEDKYHDTVLDLEAKVKENENIVLKIGCSLQAMFMLGPKPMSFYDSNLKHGLGYTNPYTLKKAISQNPKLYDAFCFSDSKIYVNVRDTEDILDDATKSQKKMENKLNDPVAIEKKQNFRTIDYNKLNALYEDFVSQKELSAKQKYFSSTFIPSENSLNASTSTSSSKTKPSVASMPTDIKEMKEVFDSTESAINATWKHNESLNDQLLEAKIKHEIGMQKWINILEKDVQRFQKQSLDFKLQLQHEKKRQKCESSLKIVCETSWISKMEKLENENVSLKFQHVNQKTYAYAEVRVQNQDLLITISELKSKLKNVEKGLSATSSVRRPMNRDSPLKNSVVSNTKKSSEKVEVSVRTNKKTYVASKNVVSNKKIVNDVDVQNALKAKDVLCVSWAKSVLIPCHDKCLAKYKLNVHSNVRRALFTTPRTAKSVFIYTTPVVSKTRFSVKTTQSKSLDTTFVVSRTKIVAVTPLSARNKVSRVFKTILVILQDNSLRKYMKNKIRTSRMWQK
ncbi:hypothetical protein Tco_0701547 [Tanacetum coccineum]